MCLQDFRLEGKKFNKNDFKVSKIEAPSVDGETIPITLIHKKKLIKDGRNKLLLQGYGHYGIPI